MADFYLGQILQGGWNFAPQGTAMCQGQTLSIAQNSALFALLGTTYGGNGTSTFQLPDLQGRTMVGAGNGAGLAPIVLGQKAGAQTLTLNVSNLPSHTHTATFANNGSSLNVSGQSPKASLQVAAANSVLGHADDLSGVGASPAIYCPSGTTAAVPLAGLNVAGTVTVGATGGSVPFSILPPYLGITIIITLVGIFPSRG